MRMKTFFAVILILTMLCSFCACTVLNRAKQATEKENTSLVEGEPLQTTDADLPPTEMPISAQTPESIITSAFTEPSAGSVTTTSPPDITEIQTTLQPPVSEAPTVPVTDLVQTTEQSLEEIISGVEGIPSFGTGMFLDPSDQNRFSPLVYTGIDFTFYYQITAGDMDAEYGIGFMLNGIYQDIRIEGKDIQTGYDTMHVVLVPAGTTKVYKIFLRPNIGRAGETLKFANATIVDPNKRVSSPNETYTSGQLSLNATLSSPFVMQSDSTNSVFVCSGFSGEVHTSYNRNIRNVFNAINNSGELCQILLGTDVDSMATYDAKDRNYLTDAKITLQRSAAAQLKIVLGGGRYGTTQRVSLYINGKIQPVFDGKSYADVTIDRTNQTELTVSLDTSALPEWNGIYLLAYTMDDSTLSSPVAFRQSDAYVLHVEG